MLNEVILPKQGLQMTEGHITKWLVNEGDRINKGDPLFEMETDKTILTVESGFSGTLVKIIHDVGDTVPVATVIGYIGDTKDSIPEMPVLKVPEKEKVVIKEKIEEDKRIFITPRAKTIAYENNVDIEIIIPSGPDGLIIARDVIIPKKTLNNTFIALTVSFNEMLKLINDDITLELIFNKCLSSALLKSNIGSKVNMNDFNIRYLANNNVSLIFTQVEKPTFYIGKTDKGGNASITFSYDSYYIAEDEAMDFANWLTLFLEKPILAYVS